MTSRPWPAGAPSGRGRRVRRPLRGASTRAAVGAVTVALAGGVAAAAFTGGVVTGGALTGGAPTGSSDVAVAGTAARPLPAPSQEPTSGAATAATPAPDAPVDARPIPVPELVDRDTVGPLWLTPADAAAGLLSLDVAGSAGGVLDVVPGAAPPVGTGAVRTVRVEVERGLPVDGAAFAETVMSTLTDPRGWGARGEIAFARTDGPADIRVVLASPDLVDALCAPLNTRGQVSCGRNGHAALNFRRWVLATPEFADRTQYRQYLVNHEVGHLLGHPHERCPEAGQAAPLMQQQSLAVAPCEPNGWPYPQG